MVFNSSKYRNFSLLRPDLIPLFWSKIDKSGSTPESQAAMLAGRVNSPCHLWGGTVSGGKRHGYGVIGWHSLNNSYFKCESHVIAYFLVKKDLPQERGLELDHICHVRYCCNPDHLEPKTHRNNQFNRVDKYLTTLDVVGIFIKIEQGQSRNSIAKQLGISRSLVYKILLGERWPQVKEALHG